ncbi:MAG: hypothetical protein M3128_05745, partial [Verrucomicrobiota bacterium]|nr:hypothetical protein [Verrucomicrobiota bacterium]
MTQNQPVKFSRLFFSLLLAALVCGHCPEAFGQTKKKSSLKIKAVRATPAKDEEDDDNPKIAVPQMSP